MKKEDVQEGIIRVLMFQDDIGFAMLSKRTEVWLRQYREKDYRLYDDVLNHALLGLLDKSVYKVQLKDAKRHVYRLAPQRKEENLVKIEAFVEDVSKRLEKISNRKAEEILPYVDHLMKNMAQLHKKLFARKHFADKETSKRITSILVRIDMVIAEGVTLVKKKDGEKLANLQTSISHTINMEYIGPSYTCGPYFSTGTSDSNSPSKYSFPKY